MHLFLLESWYFKGKRCLQPKKGVSCLLYFSLKFESYFVCFLVFVGFYDLNKSYILREDRSALLFVFFSGMHCVLHLQMCVSTLPDVTALSACSFGYVTEGMFQVLQIQTICFDSLLHNGQQLEVSHCQLCFCILIMLDIQSAKG